MVFSDYVKERIPFYRRLRKNYEGTAHCLSEEGHKVTKVGLYEFLKRFEESGTIARNPGSGKASKMTSSRYLSRVG